MPDYRKLSEIADKAAQEQGDPEWAKALDSGEIVVAGYTPPPKAGDASGPTADGDPEWAKALDSGEVKVEGYTPPQRALPQGTESITAATPPSGVNLATALPKEMAPATIGEQVTRGVLPYEPVDTTKLTEDQRDLYGALQEKLRLENRESETSKVFYGMVEGMKHPRAKEDRGALTGPLLGATAIPEAMRGAEPGSLTQEAGAAFSQKDYTGTGGHYYHVAKTPDQRDIARSLLRNDYIKSGMDADTADLRSRAKYESGAILLLPGDDHPDMAGGAETLEAKPVTLKNSWMQAGTDIAVGTAEALGNVADVGKYGIDVAAEAVRGTVGAPLRAMGMTASDEWTDRWTAWNMPSPSEVARDYLRSTDNPTAKAAAERIDSALRRGAGVMAGFAELHNVAGQAILPQALADWTKIDPNDEDGLGDAIVNVATARHDSPEPRKTAKQLVGETTSRTVGMAGELPGRIVEGYKEAVSGEKSPLDIGMENMAWGAQVVSTPVMDVMGALSTDATGKEGALGWLFRVPATAASGLITTQVARMADYGAQHLLGAESYRRHRVPGDPDMTAAEAVLPVIFTGSGLHDWLHSIYNGDSLTSEFMRLANTLAYGYPGLSDEWRARLLPGGSFRDAGIQLAMLGDLALPLDAAPRVGVGVVHGAGRFTDGYRAGRAGGMTKGEAVGLGAAGVLPSLTHRYMVNDKVNGPGYKAIWDEMSAELMANQRDALRRQGRPESEAKDVFRPDADAVYTATARAYARRFIENGGNPTNSLSAGRAGGNVAQRVREMLTTLRVKADHIDAAVRAESVAAGSHADPITRRTTATLTTMGYTADDIGHMSESEARRRIDEGVFPGDVDGSSLDPERPPAIREIERAADNLHRVARAEDAPPPGRWSEEVSKEADPYHRAGLALGQLSAYWGLPEDSVLTFRALQTAMSFYDRKRGQYRRSPLPTPTWIAERFRAGKGDHVEMGLRILRDASPKQVWRNVLAFERGETVAWTNDVRADGEATLISRKIPADPSDKNIRAWLPAEHPLVQALVEGETGGVVNTYQRIGNAGRDWLAAVAEDVRGLRSAWKGTYEQAANFYRTRAPAAGLDPLIPPSTDVRTRLAALVGRVEGRDVAALDSFIRRLDERQASLARGQTIFDAAARWLAARMEEARPKTHGGPGAISHRQRVRSDLVKLVKEKKVAATLKQIDLYFAVFDRVAARLAALKVVESPDAWWARFDITGADVEGAKGSVSFINDGRALITLAADADLSTLFHEGAHLVRRILPVEHMADIDAYVHERWGADGWNATDANGVKVAEEWFARQMESVFAEGRLHLDVRDPLSAGGRLLARVNRALRLVANVLTSIYQGLPIEVEPRMRQWVADFLKVDVAKDRIVGPEGDGLVVEDVPAEWLATVERQAGESAAQAQARIDAAYAARTERRTDAMRDRDFLVREYPALVDGVEAAARGEERARPAERVVPTVVRAEPPTPEDLAGPKFPAVSRTGWGPRMLEEVAADAERIRAIEDPKARNAAVQDWLSAVHGYIGSDKAEGSARHRLAARIGMAVVDQMLNAGRNILADMDAAERAAANIAYPIAKAAQEAEKAKKAPAPKVDQNDLLVAGKLPANPEAGTVVVDAGPVEAPPPASTEVAVIKPVKPSKAQTALAKAGEAFAERMRNRVGSGDALRAADAVIKQVAKRVAELKGEPAPDPKSSVGYLGQPASGFIQGVKDALVNLTDEKLGLDGGDLRDARARELAEDFYRRTIVPLEPTPAPVHKPSPLPDILADVGEPRVVEVPPGVDKERLLVAQMPPRGSPHLDEAGFPRAMTDEKGFAYNYRIARMKLGDLFTSHTPGLAWREGYDHAFQNRPDAFQRAGWIEKVAQTFNADSAARPNGDTPTMGAVTVWVDPQGRNVVVAGNGRSLAMVELHRRGMAGEAPYAGLLAQLQERTGGWSRALGMGEAGGGEIMVRVLDGATYEEAVRFAQNSQGVPSVPIADSAVIAGTAQKLRIASPNRKVAVERIPAEWNAETVRAMVDGSPDLWATLQELGFTNESWAATLAKDFPAALASVLGVFASTMPERIMDAASRSSEKLVNAVAMAGPAVAALVDAADRSVGLRNADIVGAFADGVELYLRATGDGAKTPEKLAAYGDEIRRQYAALSGAKVLPVSQMSFAIAAAVQRLVSPVNASGTGLASLFRDAAREVDDAMRPSMFAAPKDPVAALVNALTGDVDAVTAAREPFPATHGEAWEYARQLEVAAIEANQAMKPVVVEPPGFVDVLKQERPLQTDTPEFKAWFGGSKVVDENGRPLVQYHGTPVGEFDTFRVDQEAGAHFGTPAAANDAITHARNRQKLTLHQPDSARALVWAYRDVDRNPAFRPYTEEANRLTDAQEAAYSSGDERAIQAASDAIGEFERKPAPAGYDAAMAEAHAKYQSAKAPYAEGERVIPVYLSIKNPLWLNEPVSGAWDHPMMVMIANNDPALRDFRGGDTAALVAHIKAKGYDGIAYRNEYEGKGSTSYIAFDPEQVKSAIANRGTFDPTNPNILYHSRDYTESLSPPTPKGMPRGPIPAGAYVTSVDPGIDSAPWFEAGKGTPYGIKVSRMRATVEADPVALKLSLGFGPNQTVFGARDFAERLLAKAIVAPLQSTAWRGDYRATPGRIAIPRQRLAAVRARVMVVLGDLPNEVAEAMRTRATPAATPMLGEHLVTPIGLSHESATKIRAILDYLEATGWSSSMGDHIRAMTVSEVQEKLTQPEYVEIVGAVHDSVSGVAPFRQRPDQFSLASNLLWYWFQRPGALLTTAPLSEDSTAWERVLNQAAGVMSGAVLNIDYHINAGGSWAPDMPAHIRPIFDRYRRDIGSMPTRLVEAIEAAVGAKGPGALVAAIRSIQSELPGFVPLLGVVPNPANPGKMSDLAALRGWLYEPHTGGSFTAGQTFAPHDKPRVTPMNWQEVYQHTDLLVSVLSGNGRRRLDSVTIRLIEGLRNRTLTPDEGAMVIGKSWAALHQAERIGTNILTSAAGQSGAKGAVETILTSAPGRARFNGMAIDAYEKFYTGVWAKNPDPAAPHDSIEDMVEALGQFKAVKTHLWLAETINRLNIEAKTEEFIDNLIDHNYVHDITQMATAAGAKPNNMMHAVMLSREVADAVSADLWGTEYVSGVRDGANVNEVLMGYEGLSSPEAKGAARVIIAQSGLRPDLLAFRKGIKGELPRSGMADAMAGLSSDPVERAKQLANPQTWRNAFSQASPDGRDFFISSTMAEQIAGMVERHAPIGEHLAAILSQRNGVQFVKETLLEGMQLLKGTMITGGTNGVLAAAVAAGALYGGAPILGAVALGGAMWALAAPPRLSGYANNSLGAIMQGAIELGWGTALRTVGDLRIARLAYKASWETVQYRKMGKAVEATGKAVEALRNMLLGKPAAPENMVIISPDGTVWSIADIVRGATQYGLDGTQARFESSERIAHSYDRMAARYEASAANRYTWGLITTFFGRYTLNENYRRMYEHVDTYFRYMWLIRGLQEGLPFDQAVKRSLRISFDYTETAEVDRAINHVFLFWMYQRRALDLTMAALIEHPETVLGMIRYMRAQDLTSGYSDTDDDYVRQTETIPEYVMSRPALPGVAWLPVANVDNSAIKPMLVEPPQVTALRVLNDFGSLNLMSLIGRTNPVGQFAVNTAMAMSGGEMISFFRKRPVADSDYVIPNRLMMWDQQVTNGAFARSFGARAYYIEDPQRRAVDGYPFEWRVGESSSNRLAYDAFRSLVAGAGPLLTSMDVSDKSDNYTDKATLWLLQHMEPPPIDGTFHPAVDEHARPSVGRLMEGLRSYGLGLGTVRSVYASRQQPQKDLAASVAAALAQTEAENRAANPPEVRAPNLSPERVDADKRIGVTPDKAIGVEK